jgi:hypothetical protein
MLKPVSARFSTASFVKAGILYKYLPNPDIICAILVQVGAMLKTWETRIIYTRGLSERTPPEPNDHVPK